jgi:glycosyltransferase DesVII
LHALLPSCSLLIHHGGFGSYANALVYGVPQLTVTTPVADQLYRGAGMEEQGAAPLLPHDRAIPDAVYERVSRILSDSTFQDTATRLRDGANSRPAPGREGSRAGAAGEGSAHRAVARLTAAGRPEVATPGPTSR